MSAVTDTPRARDSEQRLRIVATAERLFREIGYQKTTVADIARELRMSPANVYRFFGAKSEITAAVVRHLMAEVEETIAAIAQSEASASDRLSGLVTAIEKMTAERCVTDRKLHDMVQAAIDEHWPIIDSHLNFIDRVLEQVIADGMRLGEFAPGNPALCARLFHIACVRFFHPRLMVECADRPGPSSVQVADFCLTALRFGVAPADSAG